jgi:hypothetical protein
MEPEAIRRAALMTLRRAIRERFTPRRERHAWLTWVATVRARVASALPLLLPAHSATMEVPLPIVALTKA